MAGISMGARAPAFPASLPSADCAVPHVPAASRKRRCHGVFSLSGELAVVYSLRRVEPGKGVQLVLGHEGPVMTPGMSPTQARNLARALVAAADAADELRAGVAR